MIRWGGVYRYALLTSLVACYEPPTCAIGCTETSQCPAGNTCSHGVCVDPAATCPTATLDITVDNTTNSDLDHVPVLVALAPTTRFGAVTEPSTDLRFRDPETGADLPFEIDHWDPAGASAVWVQAAHAPAKSRTKIAMTYGPDARGAADPPTVWSGYEAVWHMTTNSRVVDSRGTYQGALPTGAMWEPAGQAGTALVFAVHGPQVELDNGARLFDGWGAFTLEMWLRPDYASRADVTDGAGVLDKGGSLSLGRVFDNGTDLVFQVDLHFTGSNDEYLQTALIPEVWGYVVYTFDGRTLSLYHDGQLDSTSETYATPEALLASTSRFYLGDDNAAMHGAIDEVRIAKTAMPADWIRAQYLTMLGVFAKIEP